MITPEEHALISGYARGELVGGLMMGEFARRADDGWLFSKLTRHAAEEVEHAMDLIQCLEKLGLDPVVVHDPEGRHFFAQAGRPTSVIELLTMVQALEVIVVFHYEAYYNDPGTDPIIKDVLKKLVDDEDYHQDWVDEWLKKQDDQTAISECQAKYRALIEKVYEEELQRLEKAGGRLAEIATSARELQDSKA